MARFLIVDAKEENREAAKIAFKTEKSSDDYFFCDNYEDAVEILTDKNQSYYFVVINNNIYNNNRQCKLEHLEGAKNSRGIIFIRQDKFKDVSIVSNQYGFNEYLYDEDFDFSKEICWKKIKVMFSKNEDKRITSKFKGF